MIEIFHAESDSDLDEVRTLFTEYARSLDFSLCFQGFDQELRGLPGPYAAPEGRLILCRVEGKTAGCIALKKLQPEISEMKRLYVRPAFRGYQLGLRLARHIIAEARAAGYAKMRLDTISSTMPHAVALYRSLGFKEILPYYDNPLPGALYMQLDL